MLHILLTLLKIIGILILSIIGICILLVLLVIFTPLRYELNGDCKNSLDSLNINARLSYFIHLITIHIQYCDKKLEWKARVAWKHLSSDENDDNDNSKTNKDDSKKQEVPVLKTDEKALLKKSEKNITVVKSIPEKSKSEKRDKNETSAEKIPKEKSAASIQKAEPTVENKVSSPEEKKQKKSGLNEKINSIIEKLKCTSSKICDMMNLIREKSELITDFFKNEQHKSALTKLFKELKKLFKKLAPEKMHGSITFGFDDPATTGKVLAAISLLYPYMQDHFNICADFEEKKLFGDLYLKGRIRISIFLAFLLNLVLNKNVRTTISHISKLVKKLKQGGK